jgi:hypothetical protein
VTGTDNRISVQIDMSESMTGPVNEKNANAVIFVSLYLLLLAFFIFLHSVSVLQDDRVRSVLGSVNIAFAGLSQDTPADQQKMLSGEEQGTQAFHAKLKNVFETAIPLVESRFTKGGTRLQFTVPIRQLFAYRSVEMRNTLGTFLDDIAETLIARNNNIGTDLEILIGTGMALPELADISEDIAAQRVSHLSQVLMEAGVPSRNISIGMAAGDAGLIHFSFFLRPSLTFQFRPEAGAK